MGLLGNANNKGGALIDRIKFDGPSDGTQWLIYKYPGEQFVLGSQLIVNQSQEVLFIKGGQALDLFGAGTHTLQTGNLPILNKLVNIPFGGNTPFTAEVYYVNKTSKLNMNWGTPNPFPIEDPKYGLLLSIRAHGTYGIRIYDTRMFVTELVGAIPSGSGCGFDLISKYFNGLLVSKVKNVVSQWMINKKVSFLEVTGYLDEISKECEKQLKSEFDRFGTEIVNFFVETITPPKEEYEKLRQYKEELSLGTDFYTQRRSLDIMEKFSENEGAGGIASVGAGIGMGFGMANQVGNILPTIGANMNISPNGNRNTSNMKICKNCGSQNPETQRFCGTCGSEMIEGQKCIACGKINPLGQLFCGNCGAKLKNVCSECGHENELSQNFCGNCGKAL